MPPPDSVEHPEGKPKAFCQVLFSESVDKSAEARYHASSMFLCEGIGVTASRSTPKLTFVKLPSQTTFCEVVGVCP